MAPIAARKAGQIARNAAGVVAVELIAGAQGIDCHTPLQTSAKLQAVQAKVREITARFTSDRYWADDMAALQNAVLAGEISLSRFRRIKGLLLSQAGEHVGGAHRASHESVRVLRDMLAQLDAHHRTVGKPHLLGCRVDRIVLRGGRLWEDHHMIQLSPSVWAKTCPGPIPAAAAMRSCCASHCSSSI